MCANIGTMGWEHWDSNLGPDSLTEISGLTRSSSRTKGLENIILKGLCPVQTANLEGGFKCETFELEYFL